MTTFSLLARPCLLAATATTVAALAAPASAQQVVPGKPALSPAPQTSAQSTKAEALPAPIDLRQRYPKDSISSVETADKAIADAKSERNAIEARFKTEERRCYRQEFFANKCRDLAKEQRRLALNQVREVQIEAERYKRHAAVIKRDSALAEKRKQEPADAQARAASAAAHASKMGAKQQEMQRKQQTTENQRDERESAYAEKLRKAEERQRKVAEKKTKKEERRRKKVQAQADKDKPPSPPQQIEPTKR
ncbi:MAG: hypothetical protein H6R04_1616 [Burkholderiaceae bacterium]|nr:hypothetical protein [Burkholderiaceae bacterium]